MQSSYAETPLQYHRKKYPYPLGSWCQPILFQVPLFSSSFLNPIDSFQQFFHCCLHFLHIPRDPRYYNTNKQKTSHISMVNQNKRKAHCIRKYYMQFWFSERTFTDFIFYGIDPLCLNKNMWSSICLEARKNFGCWYYQYSILGHSFIALLLYLPYSSRVGYLSDGRLQYVWKPLVKPVLRTDPTRNKN